MNAASPKLRNIGPKAAAWLRQVGLRTQQDILDIGAVEAFMRVRRAGFKPSLHLLYSLEGALSGCHWRDVPEARRNELISAADAATALLPPPRHKPAPAPVTTRRTRDDLPALDDAALDDAALDAAALDDAALGDAFAGEE